MLQLEGLFWLQSHKQESSVGLDRALDVRNTELGFASDIMLLIKQDTHLKLSLMHSETSVSPCIQS